MAREKDTRVILRGVTAPQVAMVGAEGKKKGTPTSKTYLPGQEDELEKLLSDEQILQLKASGAIQGNWLAGGDKAQEKPQRPQDKPEADKADTKPLKAGAAQDKPGK